MYFPYKNMPAVYDKETNFMQYFGVLCQGFWILGIGRKGPMK